MGEKGVKRAWHATENALLYNEMKWTANNNESSNVEKEVNLPFFQYVDKSFFKMQCSFVLFQKHAQWLCLFIPNDTLRS